MLLRQLWPHSILIIFIIIFLGRVLTFTFLGDDLGFLLFLHERASEGQLLNHVLSDFASTTMESDGNFYRPLAITSYALDYTLWGTNSSGWHLTNLVLHTANSLLFFAVVRRILVRVASNKATLIAMLGALFFALRPLVGEVAVWIAGRPDALAQLGMLTALYTYLRWGDNRRKGWYGLAVVGFSVGLLSKESAVVLPGALVALHLTGLVGAGDSRRGYIRHAIIALIPFVAVLVAYFLLRYALFGSFTQVYSNDPYDYEVGNWGWWQTKADALRFLISPTRTISAIEFIVRYGLLANLVLALCLAVRFVTVRRVAAFALVWLVATLVPALPTLFINPWGEGERLLYSATAPLVLLFVTPLITTAPTPRWRRWQRAATVTVLSVALVASTFWLTHRLNSWAQASDNMRSLIAELPVTSTTTPPHRITILIIPDSVDGIFFGRIAPRALVSPPLHPALLPNLYIAPAPYEQPCQPPHPAFAIHAVACWHVPTRRFIEIDPTFYTVESYRGFWELK